MNKKPQPIVVQVIGHGGRVIDSHMGIMVEGKAHVLKGVDSLEELMGKIKGFQGANFGD